MVPSRRLVRNLTWLLLAMVILAGCAAQPGRLWLRAPGWSRAQLVGNTRVDDPVPVAFDEAGRIYLFVVSGGEGISHLRVVALDRGAVIGWDRTYEEIELTRPEKPQILWDGRVLQLFWLSGQRLYNAQVEATGQLLGPPALLSGETTVGDYCVAQDAAGSMSVWYAGPRREPGLYALPPADLTGEATLVDAEGTRPELRYDGDDILHVAWARHPPGPGPKTFLYAALPERSYTPGREAAVVTPRLVGTTVMEGPQLGLDGDNAYILWSMTYFSGPRGGTAETQYASFPKGQPSSVSSPRPLTVPYSYDLPYEVSEGDGLQAGPRVLLGPEFRGGGDYITQVEANPADDPELVVAIHARLAYLMRNRQSQVGAVFFRGGSPASYQQLSFTPASSTHPAIYSDESGQLYLTWLEKGELPGWAVYFASTAPDIREALNKLTSDDVARLAADTTFGLVSGALLIPLALVWIAPAMIVLGLTSVVRRPGEGLSGLGTMAGLTLALMTLWGIKLGFLPGMLEHVPFSAWLPAIPSWLNSPLRLGVPVLIGGLSILVARYYAHRRVESSPFLFLIVYAVLDGVLTMAVYGGMVYAAF